MAAGNETLIQPVAASNQEYDPKKIAGTELAENVKLMEAARLAAKQEELKEIECRIDEKLVELKKFVDLTKTSGVTFQVKQKTRDEEITEDCNRMLEGTGLRI